MTILPNAVKLLEFGNEVQMVGLLFQGNGVTYKAFFPDNTGDLLRNVELYLDTQQWAEVLKQLDVLDVEGLEKAILRKSQRIIESKVSWAVFRRDRYTCRYCNKSDVPLSVDHLVLWEEGGPSTEDNLVAACKKCNRTRGRMQYIDWLNSASYAALSRDLPPHVKATNLAKATSLTSVRVKVRSR